MDSELGLLARSGRRERRGRGEGGADAEAVFICSSGLQDYTFHFQHKG